MSSVDPRTTLISRLVDLLGLPLTSYLLARTTIKRTRGVAARLMGGLDGLDRVAVSA
jgi:hypothetical protein